MADVESKSSDSILYDLSNLKEWKLEKETLTRNNREKVNASVIGRISSLIRRTTWTLLRSVGIPMQTPTPCLLPEQIVRWKSSLNGWLIAVSSSANYVAIAQENAIEIRLFHDGPDTVYSMSRDPYPQWRCMVWSDDETMLVCSRSSGAVDAFDISGTLLFTIPGAPSDGIEPLDLSDAVAALIFTDFKPDSEWSAELLVVNYHGSMASYLVDRDQGYNLRYTFNFAIEYPRGVAAVTYDQIHKILFVGGMGLIDPHNPSPAKQEGLTAWRILSDEPYCKLVTDYQEEKHRVQGTTSILSRWKMNTMMAWKGAPVDGIVHLCLSPDKTTLVSLHYFGKLMLWDVPSLRIRNEFAMENQPNFDEISPDVLEDITKSNRIKDWIPHKKLVDVNFWSEELLILARSTGAVSVSSMEDLSNLLGKSPEWFQPFPQVTQAQNGGFLALECEINTPKRTIAMTNVEDEDEADESDEEGASFLARSTRVSKQVLYYVTDSERFRPPIKKPRYVTKVQKLVLLKSTTPEEKYARIIEAEEYGEALALAQAYKLDCDLVYQRQWRTKPVSLASIQDYLSKISKRAWVMHECLERVPENIDAMKELLEYGLRGTDLPALIAIGKKEDEGRFMLCDPDEGLYEDVYDEFNPESVKQREEKRKDIQQDLLKEVDFENLNLEQKELCRARLKFLQYLDRLNTYECILGGPCAAADRYNADFYSSFRSQSIFELAANYSRDNDWRALDILFTYHSTDLSAHRLAILSNFPETANPSDYKALLPSISDNEVENWEADSWRYQDWMEETDRRKLVKLDEEDKSLFLYTQFDEKFRAKKLSPALLEEWYKERSCQIEALSRLVPYAIELVKIAMDKGVETLSDLLDDFVTMEMMVYECGVDDSVTFAALQEMADYDRLELIMANSTDEMYVKHLRRWAVPFLSRCEQKENGSYDRLLRDYVLTKSRNDLSLVLKVFQSSANVASPVIRTQEELMSLVLDALYNCERDDQLNMAFKIVECLPAGSKSPAKESPEILRLHKQADSLENHIGAARIFQNHGIIKTLASIKESANDPDESKHLMIKLTRLASRRPLPLTETEWHELHLDVMNLQKRVYRCISRSTCHEIFVESLLCSEKQDTIRLAGQMLERSCIETKPSRSQRGVSMEKVTYTRAVDLVMSAAREYFDSSANLSDSCMDLARSCLNLILDAPQQIQEELDLIASLALLDEFGVAILPLQVRLRKNRLDFVKTAVSAKPTSYKQTQRLLRLGQLLGVQPNDPNEREGVIIQLAAETAVIELDYDFAFKCCERLISLCHNTAWSVCVRLAEQEAFRNIEAKVKLLSFALTYCTKDMIKPILQARCLLETQILYEKVNTAVHEGKEHEEDVQTTQESSFNARAAVRQTQQILSSTKRTTSAVLSTVTDAKWWQKAVSSLRQPERRQEVRQYLADDGNVHFNKQGCHPFYSSLIDSYYEDQSVDYDSLTSYDLDPSISLSLNVLRTAKLEEMLTQGENKNTANEALLQLASLTLARDASLGLAYLLALSPDFDVDKCFDELPSTDISLQLALYYHSLNIYRAIKPCSLSHVYALYRQPPVKAMQRVIDFVLNNPDMIWTEDVSYSAKKIRSYYEMLEDYNQACVLQRLGKGVDVVRFAEDAEYKQETILGLAMCLDDEVYNIAVALAQRYDLPLWDVYMCHLEFMFSDSGLSFKDIENRVVKLAILPVLREKSDEFIQRMMTRVFPLLAGTDLAALTYFFGLLESEDSKILCGLTASDHSKLIKKLRSVCSELDYKKLMDSDSPPSKVLAPCLTATNVNTLAKIAHLIPDKNGDVLHSSVIYCCWASHTFWAGDDNKKLPDSKAGWIHRYESLGELIQKLLPENLVRLIDDLVFTESARMTLDVSCRQEIVNRAVIFAKQSPGGKKKKMNEVRKMSWEGCVAELQSRLKHLKSLSNDTIQSFAQAEDPVFSSYAKRYDLSKGDILQVELLLVQLILDGQAIELVDDILQVAPPSSLTARIILKQAVGHIVNALRGKAVDNNITLNKSWLSALELVVENVREHQDNGGDLVHAENVMSLLRSFCSESAIEVAPRLDVLYVLEKSFHLSDADKILLTLYRTDVLVSSKWQNIQISEERINTEEARLQLFSEILANSTGNDHFLNLSRLLGLWPPFSSKQDFNVQDDPFVKVFITIIELHGSHSGSLIDSILQECTTFPLTVKCTEYVTKVLVEQKQQVTAIKMLLRGCDDQLNRKALDLLSHQEEGLEDPKLLKVILSSKLCPEVVTMPVFPCVVDYILKNQNEENINENSQAYQVSLQLKKAGFEAEAVSLLMQAQSSHSMVQTFSSALSVVGRWFKE